MQHYIEISDHLLPSYGLTMLISAIILYLLAIPYTRKNKMNLRELTIIEISGTLGGYLGAKLLSYFIKIITMFRLGEINQIPDFGDSGYAVFGGIIFGIFVAQIISNIMKIDYQRYFDKYLFFALIFLGMAKIGCFLSGCCYGIYYKGILNVKFPMDVEAPGGVGLFPVQLLDSGVYFFIAFVLILNIVYKCRYKAQYLFLGIYSPLRFITEFLRGDNEKTKVLGLSISQWISITCCLVLFFEMGKKKKKEKGSKRDVK